MQLRNNGAWFVSSLIAGLMVFSAASEAGDLSSGRDARARCEAEYGPGFTAVGDGASCVWVGGHVRVGFGSRGGESADNGWANGGGRVRVNAGDSTSAATPMSGRLRLNEGGGEMIAR